MCEEKPIGTKKCIKCGKELSLDYFGIDTRSKDGHGRTCKACKANYVAVNPKLAEFSPRELLDELAARGYHGQLTYTEKHVISL